jgi:hypothetical protein
MRLWAIAMAMAVGVVAGLVSWGAGELAQGFFKPRLFKVELMGMSSIQPTLESKNIADLKNAEVAFGLLGCVTALAMGCAGGLVARSPGRGLIVGLGIQPIGAAVALVATLALIPPLLRNTTPDPNDLIAPMLVHGGIWVPIAAVGGLAFAIGMKSRRVISAIGGACLGGVLATILFHILGAILFPNVGSYEAVPSSAVLRLLATLPLAILIAAGAALGGAEHAQRPIPTGPSR